MGKIDPGMEAMLDMYIFETTTLLEQLDEILMKTEKNNKFSDEDINEIFRIMHTIKGSSAMMNIENCATLSHIIEDMFYIIREKKAVLHNAEVLYEYVFEASDLLKAEIEIIQDSDYSETNFDVLHDKIETYVKVLKGDAEADEKKSTKADSEIAAPQKGNYADLYSVKVYFEEGCKMENLRAFLLVNQLADECEILEYFPSDVESNMDSAKSIIENGFLINFKPYTSPEYIYKLIEEALNVKSYEPLGMVKSTDKILTPEPIAPSQPKSSTVSEVQEQPTLQEQDEIAAVPPVSNLEQINNAISQGKSSKQNLISVNLQKLDQLVDIVGEIVITESMVTANPDLAGLVLDNFQKSARQLRKLTDELQNAVMSIRMVPLSGVFQKMHRIVRDMSKKLDKDVNLVISGEETEVDKTIIDNIGDPLMHLIRNSMDHGIENREVRAKTGKASTGTVTLSAQNTAGEVIITITDDGKGLDTAVLLKKAKKNGILTKPESEYSDKEIYNLIILPGFSTKDQVTEFSGRGVGMDVVKKSIEKVGGSLTIDSKFGVGTVTTIKIPLTLAIVDGMGISVGESTFTIPITSIEQSFKVDENSHVLRDTEDTEMIMTRGVCYPIVRLHELYGIETQVLNLEDGILILVETDDKAICLFADTLIGEQKVVVKPFPTMLSRYNIKQHGMTGCTILGDGSISLILDIQNLISSY